MWREHLKDATLRLQFARNYVREIEQDFPDSEGATADGRYAYLQALRAENEALAFYRRTLQVCEELDRGGQPPDESARFKTGAA